jgi:tripeptidyl-peptidase I
MLPLLLFAGAAAARVMDSHPRVPEGWTEVRKADPSEPISLKLALRQTRPRDLERTALEIATPGHANYGLHLTKAQLREFTAPAKRSVSEVSAWLRQHNIEGEVDNDWVAIRTSVKRASTLLGSEFAWYRYHKGGPPALRTLSYSVPDHLTEHVDLVQPTTRFGQLAPRHSTVFDMQYLPDDEVKLAKLPTESAAEAEAVSCQPNVTPQCLKDLYKINYTVPSDQKGNLIAFASYLEEYARYKDLDTFIGRYVPDAKGTNFSVQLVNNGLNDQNARSDSGEANLDLQYILGVAHKIPILEYSTGGRG